MAKDTFDYGKMNSCTSALRVTRRAALLGAASLSFVGGLKVTSAAAETKNVKISLDWVIQGTHAPFFVAQKKGYFKEGGVSVDAIDPGKGATNVAVNVAGGAYQFGWVDLPSMIRFNAANPASSLIAVYISFDDTPLAVITRKDAGIRKPADLNGKKIAGGPGVAVHDTISILLKGAHAPDVKIDWVNVQPQLFGPMLKRGEVAGTGGFTNSNIPAALELGMTMEDLFVIKYSDYGANMYGLALVTTKQFADQNPESVKAVVKALNRGTKDTITDPVAALKIMHERDPMMRMDIEKVRLQLALDLTDTPHVRKEGLSVVDPKKLQFTIDAMAEAYQLKQKPASAAVYTDAFLPPLSERKL
jgi:NitT/TauT family transport system substrate-binding protein